MRKQYIFIILFLCGILFVPYKVLAASYSSRHVCNNFELAKANSDLTITTVSCHNSYQEAKSSMNNNSNDNLIIIDERATSKIVDAKYALVDLTVNELTYFYESPSLLTRQYTGINTNSSYGGVDAAFIEIDSSNYAAKVKIANFTGWISKDNYEIVPLNFVKSSSSYTVTNNEIIHNYISNVNNSSSIGSRALGPKPEMLSANTYYSYDGHYFYKDLKTMLADYKNGNYNNSVNKSNPYYNYYMYLSNHTKTTYSSINIDEFTTSMGYSLDSYSDTAKKYSSSLFGKGAFFYNSQQLYGVNALLSYSLSRNETGNGRSNLSITKNNGFGLNAVDTNPYNSANYYATFASSIYGYASKWNSYGYSYATDWRYFGPAFGDKYNGMNVKYATDAYWSEKMASNYYNFDKKFGLNDYNYYQLGVVTKPTNAYFKANNSKKIYEYPEEEDQVVIVGEEGSYYKVVSDINIDENGNQVGSRSDYLKYYNWDTSYVYVSKSDIRLINKGKNGFISPNSVTSYQDAKYTYDLYVENTIFMPKVAKLNSDSIYYSDSTLTKKTNKKVLKDKLVMVYIAAYNEDKQAVSYLITSDYFYDQKAWVDAKSLTFINSDYGMQTVNIKGAYEWVCSEAIENINYKIAGQFTNSYFPILEEKYSDGKYWYKIPVSLDSNTNSFGYILKSESDAYVTKYTFTAENNAPIINANNKNIKEKQEINLLEKVTSNDIEDGNLTSKIKVIGTVDNNTPGTYKITYSVTDSGNLTTYKTINVTVEKDEIPVINAIDKKINKGDKFDALDKVSATDKEDGDLTSKIKVIKNTVNTNLSGIYEVIYQVTDSVLHQTEVKISVEVIDNNKDTKIDKKNNDDDKSNEDKDNENKDKTLIEKEGLYYFNYLKVVDNKLQIKGYHAIKGINHDKNSNITYKLLFVNTNTNKEYELSVERIINNDEFERPVYSTDSYDYTYSWFKANIDIDLLNDGDYVSYIITESDEYYAKTIISNKVLKNQVSSYKSKKTLTTRNNYRDSRIPLEFIIRSTAIGEKTATSTYNQYNQYRTFEFVGNKLKIFGTSYSMGMDLSINSKVERKIIFENTKTFKKYTYDVGSTTEGLYQVGTTLGDNLDKTKAWFSSELDLSQIEKGEYAIYISTKSNISDYGELTELLFRSLDNVVLSQNNKKYSFRINKDLRYRIELIVE